MPISTATSCIPCTRNTRSTQWQVHLALSCKGQEKNKEQLVGIAHAMMREYGMGKQPYFIYFHHDTENNHVHILTTRINAKGRRIDDHNDYKRLYASLNSVVREDQQNDIGRMFEYSFTTEGQLMNIARGFHYKTGESKENNSVLPFYHGSVEAIRVQRSDIDARIAEVKADKRDIARREETAKRLKAIIIKYRELSLKQTPYSADDQKMESEGNEKERVQTKKELMKRKKVKILHFQKDRNGVVRGYGIVDHNNKVALNGSEVMKLADIIGFTEWKAMQEAKATRKKTKHADKTETTRPSFNNRSQSSASKEKEMPKEAVKVTIYRPDSTLDIYRPMFKARACSVNDKNIVRMELDGKTYDHGITDNQTEWYCKAPTEAHDDIAIRLAVFYFYKEIYESYRRLLADAYVKESGQALELPEGSVRCYKRMNGLWHVAFESNSSTIHYDLTEQESRLMNRLEGNKAEFNEAKVHLFKEHVARDEANAIVRNLQYDSVGVFPSYASKEPATASTASSRLAVAATAGTTSMTSTASRAACQCSRK